MSTRISGESSGSGLSAAIVVSRWNREITSSLERGAARALLAMGMEERQITIVEVPGALEIPLALHQLAKRSEFDVLIALGCVIKGETAHFEYVSQYTMKGIAEVAREFSVPIGNGLLTTYNYAQAEARAADDEENKGTEAALAALELHSVLRMIDELPSQSLR